jgi:aryl-alcohol dehydrogenase-like predicted oxidoreductase
MEMLKFLLLVRSQSDRFLQADIASLQGQFLASYPFREDIFAATKYCVFHPMTVTRDAVRANVAERCRRLQTEQIDLLQFHWQFVSLRQVDLSECCMPNADYRHHHSTRTLNTSTPYNISSKTSECVL